MIKDLETHLKDVKEIDLKKLEKIVKSTVLDPNKKLKKYEIKIRQNPAFASKSRIAPERESRPIEIEGKLEPAVLGECFFCNPEKCARFSPDTGLEEQYFLNDSIAFSNLFTSGKIHGVIVYNYKQHIIDARELRLNNWIDGINLVKKIGKLSKKKYVSCHVNAGSKAASSIEHFHGQFHCENTPLSKTMLSMKLTKKSDWWKSWVKALNNLGLVVDYDKESKTALYAEWSPAFGKAELVIINLENPSFQMNDKETEAVAKFLQKSVKTICEISYQFNIVNLSASAKDSYCNQFRIFPRAPTSQSLKAWEGYLEFLGETVPHIHPKNVAELAKQMD
jgi:galactose-1-phosphate uridylyltransferase